MLTLNCNILNISGFVSLLVSELENLNSRLSLKLKLGCAKAHLHFPVSLESDLLFNVSLGVSFGDPGSVNGPFDLKIPGSWSWVLENIQLLSICLKKYHLEEGTIEEKLPFSASNVI